MKLRAPLQSFANLMEMKLAKHDEDRGPTDWRNSTQASLVRRLREELAELETALIDGAEVSRVREEAADVANFAMMIADNAIKRRAR